MKNQDLLGSGRWYYVSLESQGEHIQFILDDIEYEDFMQRNERGDRFIKFGEEYYFWSDVKRFGPLKFEEGVLSQIKKLEPKTQEYIKARIRKGNKIDTMERLRFEVSLYLDTLPQ